MTKHRRLPVFLFCGFLDSGKSTLLKDLLEDGTPAPRDGGGRAASEALQAAEQGLHALLIRTEFGDVEAPVHPLLDVFDLSLEALQEPDSPVLWDLRDTLSQRGYDEVYVEWNGTWPWALAKRLFLDRVRSEADLDDEGLLSGLRPLSDLLRLERILFVGDAATLPLLLRAESSVLPEWLAHADAVVLRGSRSAVRKCRRLIKAIRSGLPILPFDTGKRFQAQVYGYLPSEFLYLLLAAFFCTAFLFIAKESTVPAAAALSQIAFRSFSIFLQALPYLLLGVLLSSAIQVLLPPGWLQLHFPKRTLPGIAFALIAGFFLPVCDCASVPVFRGLRRQGVPLPAALTFLLASPVINPVVLLSTHAAFPDRPDLFYLRFGLGILTALITAGTFAIRPPAEEESGFGLPSAYCALGDYQNLDERGTLWSNLALWLRHASLELFSVGNWLLLGIVVSASFQTIFRAGSLDVPPLSGPLAILVMMGLAFALSLCSSSDAVVARAWMGLVSGPAVLGFLVFGPMIDLKNLALLRGSGSTRFIVRLTLTCALVCFGLCLLAEVLV